MEEDLIIHIAVLLWHEYAEADKNLKIVRSLTNDGEPDWDLRHEDMIARATQSKETAWNYYRQYKEIYGDAIRKAYGI